MGFNVPFRCAEYSGCFFHRLTKTLHHLVARLQLLEFPTGLHYAMFIDTYVPNDLSAAVAESKFPDGAAASAPLKADGTLPPKGRYFVVRQAEIT